MKKDAIIGAIQGVTKKWTKQRKREEREASASQNRHYAMMRTSHVSQKEAAWDCMEDAYMKASANDTLPALARQIMYAARGPIQKMTDRKLDDNYFTQTLLPDFMNDHPELTADWDVVFDARGHLLEPHTDAMIPLGTLNVRRYLQDCDGDLGNLFHVAQRPVSRQNRPVKSGAGRRC